MKRIAIVLSILAIQAVPVDAQTAWPRDAVSVGAVCGNAVGELNRRVAGVAGRSGGFTFANTVLTLENAVADARDRVAFERFAWAVEQDDATVDASRACRKAMRLAMVDVLADRRLYAAVARVASRPPHNAFDRALTLSWVDRLKRGGGAADAARNDRYAGFARELIGVEDTFWRNLARDRTTIRIDARQARGLPLDLVSAFARQRDGSFVVPVDDGTRSFMRYESDTDAREAFYRAYNRRAADSNVALLERAIALRDRLAHALGMESWAEYRLRSTALGGYAQAQQFLTGAAAAYATGRPPDGTAPWDVEREEAASDAPPRTLDDALDDIGSALSLRFVRSTQGVWAPAVLRYDVTDASSQQPLGTMYVDTSRRTGKQTGEGAYAILRPRGTRPGVVAIVASWAGHAGSVSGDRLVDFYRLAGRGLAMLLPAVPYESLADVSPAAEDTVAALFERFARPGAPSARSMLELTALAQIDLAFNSSGSHVDTNAVWQRVATSTFAPLYDPGTYPQVASEVFAGDGAGLVVLAPRSQTYAADLYGTLAANGNFDAQAGERFRRTVLAPGAIRRFEDEMRDFLGREARPVTP